VKLSNLFLEADVDLRKLERLAQTDPEHKMRYYRALLRSGKIGIADLELAAMFDNPAARELRPKTPIITSAQDIVDLLCVDVSRCLEVLQLLYHGLEPTGVPMDAKEEAAWAIGQIRDDPYYNRRTIKVVSLVLHNIVGIIGGKAKEILYDGLAHPLLK